MRRSARCSPGAATHLRELLMACGLLPAVDKQILLFERWLHEHLTGLADPDHVQILRRFASWNVLPQLRTPRRDQAGQPSRAPLRRHR
jgi:hypothetical protein